MRDVEKSIFQRWLNCGMMAGRCLLAWKIELLVGFAEVTVVGVVV